MKQVPLRMCAACRSKQEKNMLLRVVRTPQGEVMWDFSGKAAGRGAYVCKNDACVLKCIKSKVLNKTFKVALSDETYAKLKEQYDATKQ